MKFRQDLYAEKVYAELFSNYQDWFLTECESVSVIHIRKPMFSRNVRILTIGRNRRAWRKYVVKIMQKEDRGYDLHPDFAFNDVLAQREIVKHGFRARKYLVFDADGVNSLQIPCSITEYIPGYTLEERFLFSKDSVDTIANLLFELHQATRQKFFGWIADPLPHTAFYKLFASDALLSDLKNDNIRLKSKTVNQLKRLIERLEQIHEFCLCHADLTARNIVITAKRSPVLIDWSYCGYMHPAIDIAYLLYLLINQGLYRDAKVFYQIAEKRYERIGFDMSYHIQYFLAMRFLEVARVPTQRHKLATAELILSEPNMESFLDKF